MKTMGDEVAADLEHQEDPVLRADDPLFRITSAVDSGVGDLSADHDRYLYRKDWQGQPEEDTARPTCRAA